MRGESKITTDQDEIRKWAEARGGRPSRVKGTGGANDAGLLRLNFPGYNESSLEDISWDDFFRKFDEKKLAFLYQDETDEGKQSRFFKLISRERANVDVDQREKGTA